MHLAAQSQQAQSSPIIVSVEGLGIISNLPVGREYKLRSEPAFY